MAVQPQIMLMPQPSGKTYVEECKALLEKLKKMSPKDRLDYVTNVQTCIVDMVGSLQGFRVWYDLEFNSGRAKPLSSLNLEELKAMYDVFHSLAVTILEFDIAVTKLVDEKFKSKTTKKKEKDEKSQSHGVV